MKRKSHLPVYRVHQRQVRVNSLHIAASSKDVVLFYIDLHSKRAELFSTGSDDGVPLVMLGADKDTLYWDRRFKYPTEITFPGYKGWSVFTASVSRYTLSVALYRPSSK